MRTAQKKSGDWQYRCRDIEQSAEILNKETSAEILKAEIMAQHQQTDQITVKFLENLSCGKIHL